MAETQHFGDRRPDEERQLDELLTELRSIVDDVALGILDRSTSAGRRWSLTAGQLLTRARQRSRDKDPPTDHTRASAGIGYTNPTAGAGLAFADRDPDLDAWRTFHAHLEAMRDAGLRAVAAQAAATPAAQHPHQALGGCRNCGDPTIYRGSRDHASERCRWCYDRWIEWGIDMPRRILTWRKQGKTITPAMIRAELGEELAC